jgi:hypothetical protein
MGWSKEKISQEFIRIRSDTNIKRREDTSSMKTATERMQGGRD